MAPASSLAMAAIRAVWAQAAYAFHHPAVLGTRFNLLINADGDDQAAFAAWKARTEIDRLNAILNGRNPNSEISRLNNGFQHEASEDLFNVVAAAERWRQASGGAYSPRLGHIIRAWREADQTPPEALVLQTLAQQAADADIGLDAATRTISRPPSVHFDLDGLAKGYVIDRVLDAVLGAPGVSGALLDIGGDIRCAGPAPDGGPWLVGLPQPLVPYDNAPLLGRIGLRDQAIATSGCGPRDRLVGARRYSETLDPRTGWTISCDRSTTVIAASAMDADALATALLNLSAQDGDALVQATAGAAAHVTGPAGSRWLVQPASLPGARPVQWIPVQARDAPRAAKAGPKWPNRQVAYVTFTAPPKQMKRDLAFRSPYVAIWVSDMENRPVRTLFLIGSIKEYQRDNYIWWGLNRDRAIDLVSSRSFSTRGTGEYKVLWDGVDESGKLSPAGKYLIHVETSRELGKHTHRSVEIDASATKAFTVELPATEEAGHLEVTFDRF
jgi:thiamine biosynthesis lipoprotein